VSTRRSRERAREVFTGRRFDGLSAEETDRARCAGYEPDGEYLVSRDPRTMSQDELKAMGHEPMSPMEAIRLKCLDCCAGSAHEVRCCVAVTCPLWAFRLSRNPWRAPISEARRAALRERGFASSNSHKIAAPSAGMPSAAISLAGDGFAPSNPHKIAGPPSLVGSQTGEAPVVSKG
jgi:hypothetical protein